MGHSRLKEFRNLGLLQGTVLVIKISVTRLIPKKAWSPIQAAALNAILVGTV